MIIAAGQTVTFQGDFTMHPLARGTVSDANAGSPGNPIPAPPTNTGASLGVTYPAAGTFPYHCTQHTAEGMNGTVQVQ
jgi:plastocyanin